MKLPRTPQRTTPGFAFSMVERCLRDGLGKRKFGAPEQQEVLNFFFGDDAPACVYCGSNDVRRWDHLIPISEGGEAVLGNMVPACQKCDDSKGGKPFDEWMDCETKSSLKARGISDIEKRKKRLREYARHFGYKCVLIEERLTRRGRKRLEEIRKSLQQVRAAVTALLEEHQAENS